MHYDTADTERRDETRIAHDPEGTGPGPRSHGADRCTVRGSRPSRAPGDPWQDPRAALGPETTGSLGTLTETGSSRIRRIVGALR